MSTIAEVWGYIAAIDRSACLQGHSGGTSYSSVSIPAENMMKRFILAAALLGGSFALAGCVAPQGAVVGDAGPYPGGAISRRLHIQEVRIQEVPIRGVTIQEVLIPKVPIQKVPP